MAWTAEYSRAQHHSNITGPCQFRIGVDCDKFSHCSRCGWNPKVEAVRIAKLHEPDDEPERQPIAFLLGGATFDS